MRRPALVRLANTTVAFKGNATDPQYRAALNSLAATLETELVSNEKTLIKQPEGSAEWTVALTITGFQVPPPDDPDDDIRKLVDDLPALDRHHERRLPGRRSQRPCT